MQQESRVKKSLLNARVNLIFYFLTLALSFFSRKVFLDCLGADFIGLAGTLGNLLGFLNLAELGIGTAIGYVLYKPLFDQNKDKINEIISVLGYLYRWIGFIILFGGCVLACLLPWIFPNTEFEYGIIYFAFFSYLFSSLIGYFINYRQTLLGADQKNYVVTAYFQTANIIKVLIQMASAYYTRSYYLWVCIEMIFGVIYSIILNWKINQVYPWLKSDVKSGKELRKKYPEVMKYTKQLFVHKLGTVVQFQTTPLLIYSFVSLPMVALYENYTIVTTKMSQLLYNVLGSTGAGIGNLIAEGKKEKILNVYWELMLIRILIASVVVFSMYHLLPPFIKLWLGEEYLLPQSVMILVLTSFFLGLVRGTTDEFINGFGLFYDIWAPIVESMIYILVAVIGGVLWGLEGVLLGGIISTLIIIYGWRPYFLFTKGFHISIWKYWKKLLGILTLVATSYYLVTLFVENVFVLDYCCNWWDWILKSILITAMISFVMSVTFFISMSEMRSFVNRFLHA